jgi:hypothetical protein
VVSTKLLRVSNADPHKASHDGNGSILLYFVGYLASALLERSAG